MRIELTKAYQETEQTLIRMIKENDKRIGYMGWQKGKGLYPLLKPDDFTVFQTVIDSHGHTHTEAYWTTYSFRFHYYNRKINAQEKKNWLEKM